MLERIVIVFCFFSLGYSILFYFRICKKSMNTILMSYKRKLTIKKIRYKLNKIKRNKIQRYLLNLVRIDSLKKLENVIFILSFAIILIFPNNLINIKFFKIILRICLTIVFIGIGKFLSLFNYDNFIYNIYFYALKLFIFVIYSVALLTGFLEKIDNQQLLIVSVIISLGYSICFLKGVIDGFYSLIFYIINLVFVYVYDLIIIGFSFGLYYLNKNDIFKFYNQSDLYNNLTLQTLVSIIQKGLIYFFSFPTALDINSLDAAIPFLEYIMGTIFNLLIVSFFISYTASKSFNNHYNKKDI